MNNNLGKNENKVKLLQVAIVLWFLPMVLEESFEKVARLKPTSSPGRCMSISNRTDGVTTDISAITNQVAEPKSTCGLLSNAERKNETVRSSGAAVYGADE